MKVFSNSSEIPAFFLPAIGGLHFQLPCAGNSAIAINYNDITETATPTIDTATGTYQGDFYTNLLIDSESIAFECFFLLFTCLDGSELYSPIYKKVECSEKVVKLEATHVNCIDFLGRYTGELTQATGTTPTLTYQYCINVFGSLVAHSIQNSYEYLGNCDIRKSAEVRELSKFQPAKLVPEFFALELSNLLAGVNILADGEEYKPQNTTMTKGELCLFDIEVDLQKTRQTKYQACQEVCDEPPCEEIERQIFALGLNVTITSTGANNFDLVIDALNPSNTLDIYDIQVCVEYGEATPAAPLIGFFPYSADGADLMTEEAGIKILFKYENCEICLFAPFSVYDYNALEIGESVAIPFIACPDQVCYFCLYVQGVGGGIPPECQGGSYTVEYSIDGGPIISVSGGIFGVGAPQIVDCAPIGGIITIDSFTWQANPDQSQCGDFEIFPSIQELCVSD